MWKDNQQSSAAEPTDSLIIVVYIAVQINGSVNMCHAAFDWIHATCFHTHEGDKEIMLQLRDC